MLKPKYVHGLNADEAPQSLLHRLQHSGGQQMSTAIDDLGGGTDDDNSDTIYWAWSLG